MPRIFEPLYVNLVAAGEASGALPQILLAAGQAFDAGKRTARSRATGVDLSGISRVGWRSARYNFYHVHGAAVERVYGANWRRASITYTDSAANSSCDHRLLVGRRLAVIGVIIGFRAFVRS